MRIGDDEKMRAASPKKDKFLTRISNIKFPRLKENDPDGGDQARWWKSRIGCHRYYLPTTRVAEIKIYDLKVKFTSFSDEMHDKIRSAYEILENRDAKVPRNEVIITERDLISDTGKINSATVCS